MGENKVKIQYYPGFCVAAELEFRNELAQLEFNAEYNLSKEPLRIDLLVIRKNDKIEINNEVGKIFKKHNIIEYKSPDDGLTIDDFYKAISYACLYKALGKSVNEVKENQITVSIFRDRYPRELFNELEKSGRTVTKKYPGVYYVTGNVMFDIQVVVIKELDKVTHSTFRMLSNDIKEEDIRNFISQMTSLSEKGDRINISAVLEVSIAANKSMYRKIRSEQGMSSAIEELMWDVIVKNEEKGAEKKLIELVCKKMQKNKTPDEIAEALEEEYAKIKVIYDEVLAQDSTYDAQSIYESLKEKSAYV